MKVKKKITAMALALTMVFAMVPLMGAENSYAMVDEGEFIMDLSKGPVTYDMGFFLPAMVSMSAMGDEDYQMIGMTNSGNQPETYFDLDKNNTTDIVASMVDNGSSSGPPAYKFEVAETCSVGGVISFQIKEEQAKTTTEKMMRQTAPSGMTQEEIEQEIARMLSSYPFASTVTFILPLKANTLTLKGKTVKIKAKKLKKKKKTYAISKFLTVSKAQGTVTYAKVSGNKKIKIASNGKVTLKKKLKKGKYKVTVKVTAAGNNTYQPVTKNATFKIKVK